MGLLDKILNREKPKNSQEVKQLLEEPNIFSNYGFGSIEDQLKQHSLKSCNDLVKSKGIQCLYHLLEDDTISSDVALRLESISCAELIVEAENEAVEQLIIDSLKPHLYDLISSIFNAKLFGYSITEIIYDRALAETSGIYKIDCIYHRKPHQFIPLFDMISCVKNEQYQSQTKLEPFGKYLVSSNGNIENPQGTPLLGCLYWLQKFRSKALHDWSLCLYRYAKPFAWGKTESKNQKTLFSNLKKIKNGSSIVTDKDTDIEFLNAPSSGGQFLQLEDLIRKRIHLAILGQTLTSESGSSGSLAQAKVHENVRKDILNGDLRFIEKHLNKLASTLKVLNGFDDVETKLTLEIRKTVDLERCERDAKLLQTGGIRFTKEYYLENYNLNENDFEVVAASPNAGPTNLEQLVPENVDKPGHICGESFASKFETQYRKDVSDIEDTVKLLNNQDDIGFDVDSLFNIIQASDDQGDLITKLATLSNNPNVSFEQLLTEANYYVLSKGVAAKDSE